MGAPDRSPLKGLVEIDETEIRSGRSARRRTDGGAHRSALGASPLRQPQSWPLGVYHGLRRKHLQSYLDEFAFRFIRRRTRHAAFCSLLGIAVAVEPVTYNMLIKP